MKYYENNLNLTSKSILLKFKARKHIFKYPHAKQNDENNF